MSRHTHTLTVFAAGALFTPMLSIGVAHADGEATPPPSQSFADFCQEVPADFNPFTDIDGNMFQSAIECLAFTGVTQGGPQGQPSDTYGPGLLVDRGAMASFIARLIDEANELSTDDSTTVLPAYDGEPAFSDIEGTTHEANISRLADAGIVAGGPAGADDDEYVPTGDVSRAQMATFIAKAFEYVTGEAIATDDDYYTDDTGTTHETQINAITSLGIAIGTAPDTYSIGQSIDRDNMAAFLTRTFGALEQNGVITPATASDSGSEPVDEGQQTATDAPELVSTELVEDGDDFVTFRYSFDEDVSSRAPAAELFHLYALDAALVADGNTARVDEENPSDVLVAFDVSPDQFDDVTVATVDSGAVQDTEDNVNPEGADGVQVVDFASGTTTAPDLVEVRDFEPTTDEVEFVFDEPVADVLEQTGFLLVQTDGNEDVLRSDTAVRDSDDPTVVHVTFADTIDNDTEADTARAAVEAGTVNDGEDGSANPLQIVEVAEGGSTQDPDLESVTFDTDNDRATYTFDESIEVTGTEASFQVYDRNGAQTPAETVTRSSDDPRVVVAEFADNQLEDAFGASVLADAVQGTTGNERTNEVDEVGVQGAAFEAGRTTVPDLLETRVELGSDTEDGSDSSDSGDLRVVYVFDETVDDLVNPAQFFLSDEDGDRTVGAEATRNEQNQNEVFVTFGEQSDVEIEAAVVATVDNDAVLDDNGTDDSEQTPVIPGADEEDTNRGNVEGYTLLQQR
jgi:hypothetical protein